MKTLNAQINFDLPSQPLLIPSEDYHSLPILDWHINLLNGKLSAKGTKKPMYGKLVCHAETAVIYQPVLRVQCGGRERAVREKSRNVHAFARGFSVIDADVAEYLCRDDIIRVRYNPFKFGYFYREDTMQRVDAADLVVLDHHSMFAINPS